LNETHRYTIGGDISIIISNSIGYSRGSAEEPEQILDDDVEGRNQHERYQRGEEYAESEGYGHGCHKPGLDGCLEYHRRQPWEWLFRTATLCRWLGSECQSGCALFFNFWFAPKGLPLKGALTLCAAQRFPGELNIVCSIVRARWNFRLHPSIAPFSTLQPCNPQAKH